MGSRTATSEPSRRRGASDAGFTLAGLIVILTIIMIFIAYTVPRQWSKIVQRDRERQTIFVMKLYARAIREWQKKHGGGFPTSLDQMKEARLPRIVRGPTGELLDPLTGKFDWVLVPPGAYVAAPGGPGGPGGGGGPIPGGGPGGGTRVVPPPTTGTTGTQPGQTGASGGSPFNSAASPKDYKGPFIGVRPPVTGKAMLKLGDAENYEEWFYTVYEAQQDEQNHIRPSQFK